MFCSHKTVEMIFIDSCSKFLALLEKSGCLSLSWFTMINASYFKPENRSCIKARKVGYSGFFYCLINARRLLIFRFRKKDRKFTRTVTVIFPCKRQACIPKLIFILQYASLNKSRAYSLTIAPISKAIIKHVQVRNVS